MSLNRIFNTWVGEPSKLILLKAVLDTIVQEKLLDQVTEVGQQLPIHDILHHQQVRL